MTTVQTPAVLTPAVPTPAAPTHTSRTRTVVLAAAALVAGAGITAGVVVLGLGSTAPAAPAATPAAAVVVPSGSDTHHHVTPVTPVHPVAPSAAIETLQRELGQLNYYEGPVTGIMNAQTTQAITYLQRDAHLPQTGTMNTATRAALADFLAHGNNQMGS